MLLTLMLLIGAREVRVYDPAFIASLRSLTFDAYQRLKPREPLGQPIRIIDIDEESIAELGQWPWPRTYIARLLDRIQALGGRLCRLRHGLFRARPDRPDRLFFRELEESDWPGRAEIKAFLSAIPDNDLVLAQSMARVPTVLGFFNEPRSQMGLAAPKAGFVVLGEDPAPLLSQIRSSVMSLPPFREAAAGSGTISLGHGDADGVVRRVPMFIADGEKSEISGHGARNTACGPGRGHLCSEDDPGKW
ncbi:CHASE2 domain-containing protein [Roseibium salinum]|nr:CHASE2 domain-containing protein [Roseibium salinum]